MANRSYLYLIDFDRSQRKREESDKITGLAEYSYELPLAFKILISQGSQLSPSIIWDYEHPISIIGNFGKGADKLISFLNALKQKNYYSPTALDKLIQQTITFLNDKPGVGTFAYLEACEIYQLIDEPIEQQNKKVFDEISDVDGMISNFYLSVQEKNAEIVKWQEKSAALEKQSLFQKILKSRTTEMEKEKIKKEIDKLERRKLALLGIDNWSEVLYFHFKKG